MNKKYIFLLIILITLFSCITSPSYLESRYIKLGEDVLPSVVEIISVGIDGEGKQNWQDFFQDQEDFQNKQLNTGIGSGVVLDSDDNWYYILTNKHVVAELNRVSVLLYNNKLLTGEVLGFDERFDVAVVKIPKDYVLPAAKVNLNGNYKVGQFVAALGAPMSYTQSLSMGVISNIGRFGGPKDNLSNYIQTDAAINHGNSGGPLVNIKGEVIGLNTWISSPTNGSIGLGFAMPIENVYKSYKSIISNGSVAVAWFGVSSYGLPNSEYYAERDGAFINQVVVDSPAHKVGIKPGDIVLSINNHKITGSDELFLQISLLSPNENVNIVLERDENIIEYNLLLGELEENVLETSKKVFPGFIFGKRDDSITILQILPKSIGLSSGFLKDDIIKKVNGNNIDSIEGIYSYLKKGENLIVIGRESTELELKLNF